MWQKSSRIEINKKWVDVYNQVCKLENVEQQDMRVGDSKEVLKAKALKVTILFLTDVPYWNMDKVERSNGKFKKSKRSNKKKKIKAIFQSLMRKL